MFNSSILLSQKIDIHRSRFESNGMQSIINLGKKVDTKTFTFVSIGRYNCGLVLS